MTRRFATLLAVVVLGWLGGRTPIARAADTTELDGKPAPDFTLPSLDGKDVKLSQLKGNVVVLDFWATWCPPCRKSLPHLNKVANDASLKQQGLKVYAVNCRETKDKAKTYLQQNSLTFNVVRDESGSAMKDYLITGIPTTVVVGRDGMIREVFIGFGGEESEKQLDNAIHIALMEPKPAK